MVRKSLTALMMMVAVLGAPIAFAGTASAAPACSITTVGGVATCSTDSDGDGVPDDEEDPAPYLDEELEWELMTPEEREEFEKKSADDERLIEQMRKAQGQGFETS